MAEQDPVRAAKVAKPKSAERVPATEGAALEAVQAEATTAAPEAVEPELTPEELEQATAQLDAEVITPPAPRTPPTYRVKVGGRAYYRGQQIRFREGETFTSETWDEGALVGFRECGVTIEQIG